MAVMLVHAGFNGGHRYVLRLLMNDEVREVWALRAVAPSWGSMNPLMPPQGPWIPEVGSNV